MAIFKCKMCGGALEINNNESVAICEYCGTQQTLPKIDDEKKLALFNRANNLRLKSEFDKAAGIYESIIAEFPEEAEAFWGLVLCKYGIEYVDDKDGSKIPTCHRTLPKSIMKDEDFEQACENADISARTLYREEAKAIDAIQKKILEIAATEEPYDIFICYKETDDITGARTEDSSIAQDIYTALTEMGYKVFYARSTLRRVAGREYEPYIYAALSNAKIMLAIGTKFEYYDAVWVKNEWSRFISMMANNTGKILIPCFKNMDAYDIPEDFSNMQALDMGEVTFFGSLTESIKRTLAINKAPEKKTLDTKTSNNHSNRQNNEIAFNDGYYIGESIAGQPNGYGTRVWSDGSKYEGEWKYGKQNGQGTFTNKDGSTWTGEYKDGTKWTGNGVLFYTSGEKYEGEFVNGKRHGKGVYYFKGDKYEGEFVNGKIQGSGVWYLSNGEKYEGKFADGKPNGYGININKDGSTWEGEFRDGKKWNGKGTILYKNGDKYEGELFNGNCHGKGVWYLSGGDKYEGEFLNGKRHGYGMFTNKDGSTLEGEFKDGNIWNGKGTAFYTNGNVLQGEFVNGKLEGKGSFKLADGRKYEGELSKGLIEGTGVYYHANGEKTEGTFKNDRPYTCSGYWNFDTGYYKGQFVNGNRHGKGTFVTKNGDKYEGDWVNNLAEGKGISYHANGRKYEGEFSKGVAHGRGVFTNKNGSTWEGEFKNDLPWNGKGTWYNPDGSALRGRMRNGKLSLF